MSAPQMQTTDIAEPPPILFVTCYVQLYGTDLDDRSLHWRIQHFLTLAKTGISLCVFACEISRLKIQTACSAYPNVYIYPAIFDQCILMRTVADSNAQMPLHHNKTKDTKEYMSLMHGKMDFVHQAMQMYPLVNHFAWIDFSIAYIFRQPEETCARLQEYMTWLAHNKKSRLPLFIPGCTKPPTSPDILVSRVYWRFCGGFFCGGRESMAAFYAQSIAHLPLFLKQYQTIVWEVNFWAWMEAATSWAPVWIPADHNDSILFPFSQFHI